MHSASSKPIHRSRQSSPRSMLDKSKLTPHKPSVSGAVSTRWFDSSGPAQRSFNALSVVLLPEHSFRAVLQALPHLHPSLAPHRQQARPRTVPPRSLPTSFVAVSRHPAPEIVSSPTSRSRLRRIPEAQRGS